MGDTLRVVGAPTKHEFLSPDWIAAVEAIRDEYTDRAAGLGAPPVVVRANVVVTDAPFATAEVHGHIDTSLGLAIAPGHLDRPDFTASIDYETAKALFVSQDPAAVMQAFFGGKIRLTGDASKLLAMPMPKPGQTGPEVDLFREVAGRVQAVTV
jgi:hypothetical protein